MRSFFSLAFFVLAAGLATAPAARADGAGPTPLTQEFFLAALTREISTHYNFEGDLQLDLLRLWTSPARVATNWEVTVQEFPAVPASSMLVRCRIVADGALVGDTSLMLRAALWRDAWATRQPLTAGMTFDPGMLEARRVDTLRERDLLPAVVGDKSYIFARGIPGGRMLTWHDIARRPLVRKGGTVEVSAADGLLNVSMKALAMENGAQGDTITVRNPESRRDFAATVIDENHVQVRF
jgi:flagella basal body P-ring formation protein FlgA